MRSVFITKTIAFYIAISLCAVFVFIREFSILEGSQPNSLSELQTPIDPRQSLALSLRATHATLQRCERALSPPGALIEQGQVLQGNARACQQIANRILSSTPGHSYAHFIVALSAYHLGQAGSMGTHLAQSTALAPFEGWLAQRRLSLAFGVADQQTFPSTGSDIGTLLTTQAGAEFLARFYMHRPKIRGAIAQRLEQATASDQTRFINLLKKARVWS